MKPTLHAWPGPGLSESPGHEPVRAAAARLAAVGVLLRMHSDGPVTPRDGGPTGINVVLRPEPRSWWDTPDWVECAGLEDLVRLATCTADVLRALAADPVASQAGVRSRVGRIGDGEEIWLFGAGLVGRQVATLLSAHGQRPRGFLDNDPGLQGTVVSGLRVASPAQVLPEGACVVVCTGRHHASIIEQLKDSHVGRVLHPSELVAALGLEVEPERGYERDLIENGHRYVGLAARLADNDSRRTLAAVLAHRRSFSPEPLREVCRGDQWFIAEVFRPDARAVFVDGGAYDGDSAGEFITRNGTPGQSLELFEPDAELCSRARRRFARVAEAHVHNAGLGARAGAAPFSATGGMDGALGDGDGRLVPVVALDDVLGDGATYVKLDVEGAEEDALEGGRGTIVASTPVLAVAAYHRAHDLWRLPAWIDRLGAGYRLYLRHHTELSFETVVYATP